MGVLSGKGTTGKTDVQTTNITADKVGDVQFETDVKGVYADAMKSGMPVFNVSPNEFNQNMRNGRKRLRFKSGTNAQQYMRNTKYNKPFWIQNKDDGYVRKIK